MAKYFSKYRSIMNIKVDYLLRCMLGDQIVFQKQIKYKYQKIGKVLCSNTNTKADMCAQEPNLYFNTAQWTKHLFVSYFLLIFMHGLCLVKKKGP